MTIKEQIEARQRQARLDRDEQTLNVIGMLKSKVLNELKSGSGVQEDDALWTEVIGGYLKQLRKQIPEFEKVGERGREAIAGITFEIGFCEQFLPKKLDEAATEAIVRETMAKHGISDPKMIGKLMGMLMKEHKDVIDGELARKIAQRVLGGS